MGIEKRSMIKQTQIFVTIHSMTRANLNKSKEVLNSTSKVHIQFQTLLELLSMYFDAVVVKVNTY